MVLTVLHHKERRVLWWALAMLAWVTAVSLPVQASSLSLAASLPRLSPHQCTGILEQVFSAAAKPEETLVERWQKRYDQLRQYKMVCYDHADFLVLLGSAELNTGRLFDAQDNLERALMLTPPHAQAQILYAQVLQSLGQPFAALDLNRQILNQQGLSEDLTRFLQARSAAWDKSLTQNDYRLMVSLGYDSNLNTAVDQDVLTLSDGQMFYWPLENRPVGGKIAKTSLGASHSRVVPDGWWQAKGNLYVRTGVESRLQQSAYRHDHQQLDLAFKRVYQIGRAGKDTPSLFSWEVAGRGFWYNERNLFNAADLKLNWRYGLPRHCSAGIELQLSGNRYLEDARQNALVYRVQPELKCSLDTGWVLYVQAGLALDEALGERTGGARHLADLLLSAEYEQGDYLWRLNTRFAGIRDQKGYQAYFDHFNPREVQSIQVSAQVRKRILQGVFAELSLHHVDQSSNVSLFGYQAERVALGLDWRF